jgi:hypothetical protein
MSLELNLDLAPPSTLQRVAPVASAATLTNNQKARWNPVKRVNTTSDDTKNANNSVESTKRPLKAIADATSRVAKRVPNASILEKNKKNFHVNAKSPTLFTVAKAKEERPVEHYSREVIQPVSSNVITPISAHSQQSAANSGVVSEQEVFAKSPFAALGLSPAMCRNLESNLLLSRPTVVQERAIAHIVARRDIVLKGRTGLGKTLAFLLPDHRHAAAAAAGVSRQHGTYAVIVAPTKELAGQLYEETWRVMRQAFNWIVPGVLSGGRKKDSEKKALRKGLPIVISTPGRLLDHSAHHQGVSRRAHSVSRPRRGRSPARRRLSSRISRSLPRCCASAPRRPTPFRRS